MSFQEESIETLESQYQLEPDSFVFSRLADAYRKNGDTQKAIDVCASGLERHSNYVTGRIILGRCYLEQEDMASAVREFTRVCQLDRRNAIAVKMLADIFVRQEKNDKAGDLYGFLSHSDPENESLSHLAKSTQGSGAHDLYAVLNIALEPVGSEVPIPRTDAPERPSLAQSMDAVADSFDHQSQSDIELLQPAEEAGAYEVIETVDDIAGDFDTDITGEDITSRMNMMFTEEERVPVSQEPAVSIQPEPVDKAKPIEPEISGADISNRIDQLFSEDFSPLAMRQAMAGAESERARENEPDGPGPGEIASVDNEASSLDASIDSAETIAFDESALVETAPENETIPESGEEIGKSQSLVDDAGGSDGPVSGSLTDESDFPSPDATTDDGVPEIAGDDVAGRLDEMLGLESTADESGVQPVYDATADDSKLDLSGFETDSTGDAPESAAVLSDSEIAEPLNSAAGSAGDSEVADVGIGGEDIEARLDTMFGDDDDDESIVPLEEESEYSVATADAVPGDFGAITDAAKDTKRAVDSDIGTDALSDVTGADVGQRLDDLFGTDEQEIGDDAALKKQELTQSELEIDSAADVVEDIRPGMQVPAGETADPFQVLDETSGGSTDPLLAEFPSSGVPIDQTMSIDIEAVSGAASAGVASESDIIELPSDSVSDTDEPEAGSPLAVAAGESDWSGGSDDLSNLAFELDSADPTVERIVSDLAGKNLLETAALEKADTLDFQSEQVSGQDVSDRLDILLSEGEGEEAESLAAGPDTYNPGVHESRIAAADTEEISVKDVQDVLLESDSELSGKADTVLVGEGLGLAGSTSLEELPGDADGEDEAVQEFYDVSGEGASEDADNLDLGIAGGIDAIEMDEPLDELGDTAETEPDSNMAIGDLATPRGEGVLDTVVAEPLPGLETEPAQGSVLPGSANLEEDPVSAAESSFDTGHSGPKSAKVDLWAEIDGDSVGGEHESVDTGGVDSSPALLDEIGLEHDEIPEDAPEEEEAIGDGFYTVSGNDTGHGGEVSLELTDFETVEVDDKVVDILEESAQEDADPEPVGDTALEPGPAVQDAPPAPATQSVAQPQSDLLSGIPDHVLTPTLADIYYQQGQILLAVQIYQRLLKRDPDNEKIARRLTMIEAEVPALAPEEISLATHDVVEETVLPPAKVAPKKKSAGTRRKRPAKDAPLAGVKIKKKYRERLTKRTKKS